MPRLKLELAYTGGNFHGWQLQPGLRTVQGVLEQALERICKVGVRVYGAGRTDAGAHALGQVAHLDLPENKVHVPWQKALNALLPWDVAVLRASWCDTEFHARFKALAKEYSYTLWTQEEYLLPQREPFVWKVGKLDLQAMQEAAEVLQGRHDFRAVQNVGTTVQSTVRNLQRIDFSPGFFPQETVIHFFADGFLKQMARNLASCLVAVGTRRMDVSSLQNILNSGQRQLAPATAPAKGLCLQRVCYPEGLGGDYAADC
ncbi:MAG: tRNA pseudouridine(38-40) synthase TruA [Desulfohalobiaceae bacterium]